MSAYAETAAKAKDKLTSKGMDMQHIRIVQPAGGGFDPETGLPYSPTETVTDFYGVKTQPTAAEVQSGAFQNVTMVVLAPADMAGGEIPTTAHKLRFGGRNYDITEVRTVAPAETVMLYKMGVQDAGAVA
ncbi:hypothetical protein [Desulfovibrio falkowii]|uniref:Head-tail joining protein n=1 Tax=Desulfovibrio falkowii TaxID=3136602 RepID=A0ABQ0E9S9_9BACT